MNRIEEPLLTKKY